MSVDLSQFHETFFEEAQEALELMESTLLALELGDPDVEQINTIFRSAHSIKGGSGTFGFTAVAEFTHVVETLLDLMRGEKLSVDQPVVDLLLQSVDGMRELLEGAKQGESSISPPVAALLERLKAYLSAPTAAPSAAASGTSGPPRTEAWRIDFRPHAHLLRTGNDPVFMIRELRAMGDASVTLATESVPPLAEVDPEDCHLEWSIHLVGDVTREQISEVFEWVDGDCDLVISPVSRAASSASTDGEPSPGVSSAAVSSAAVSHDGAPSAGAPSAATASVESAKTTTNSTAAKATGSAPAERPKVESSPEPKSESGAATPRTGSSAKSADTGSIRVGISKVDELINMVGELVITQSMLDQLGHNFDMSKLEALRDGLTTLERHTRELQESVMRIRMLPIGFSFNRFPRMVHDVSARLGKKVELKLSGEGTELDKTVLEKINDPLVHCVRNSLDHGIETPEERVAAGKSETGTLHLNSYHQGGNIVIEIADDGRGLDRDKILGKAIERGLVRENDELSSEQIYDLVFMPGFSTADQISDVSGRGVGMDVVRRNVQELGGTITVESEIGRGTKVSVRLPLTLAILDGQTVRVGDETFIMPLVSIVESIQVRSDDLNIVAGRGEVFRLREDYLPVLRLYELFDKEPEYTSIDDGIVVVVEGNNQRVGVFVDELLGQQQIVIKSLETNYRRVAGLSGATILGDGSVALILDVPGLIRLAQHPTHQQRRREAESVAVPPKSPEVATV